MVFKHGWKNPASLTVATVKNLEFKITQVVLNQGASSHFGRSRGTEHTGDNADREKSRASVLHLDRATTGGPQATLPGAHLPDVHGFPKCPRDPAICLCPERVFFFTGATNALLGCGLNCVPTELLC